MAKLLKLRRGTTTQHASFTGAEGEVTIDTTKDTAVVHDGSQAGGRPMAREDMSNVSSASIAGQLGTDSIAVTKIAAGTLPSDVKITDSNISGSLTMATGDINDNAVTMAKLDNSGGIVLPGNIGVQAANMYNNAILNATVASNAAIAGTKISPNFGSQAVTTTGNIVVGGTVDGRDVAADGTKLDGIATSANNYSISSDLLDEDNMASNSQTKVASQQSIKAYVDAEVANVVNSAPAALNTLNELAAALGDDANYATTTATSIGTKLSKSGGEMNGSITMAGTETVDGRDLSVDGSKLDGIESGATADQSASEILTLIKTVDGSGSGLDADVLDGIPSGSFVRNDNGSQSIAGNLTVGTGTSSYIYMNDSDHGQRMIHNNSNQIGFLKQDGSWGAHCDDNGNWTAVGNVTAYSDVRLKTDIHTINDALSICGKLRGVSYKWIADGKPSIGVIAQEVEAVIPELVVTNNGVNPVTQEIEEIKSVDYGKIVGVLINAINELKAELDEHKKGGK